MDRRVVPITAALSITGALGGALAGGLAVTVAGLVYLHSLAPIGLHGIGAGVGAALGLLVWPALAWSLLRRVALGRAGLAVAIGAVLGGASGLLAGAHVPGRSENFLEGTAPTAEAPPPGQANPDRFLMEEPGRDRL